MKTFFREFCECNTSCQCYLGLGKTGLIMSDAQAMMNDPITLVYVKSNELVAIYGLWEARPRMKNNKAGVWLPTLQK